MNKVSVIVPVYNVEPYLPQCLQSILTQTYPALEVLLIDDGSTDGSPALCDAAARADSRVRVVHQPNAGLGMARNAGLGLATGTFVQFVDSDDWLDPRATETLVAAAQAHQAELVACGFLRVLPTGSAPVAVRPAQQVTLHAGASAVQAEVLLPLLGSNVRRHHLDGREMCVWMNLYRLARIRELGVRFVSEREYLTEDFFFNLEYLRGAQRAVLLPDCLYWYRQNPVSLSNQFREDRFARLCRMAVRARAWLAEYGLTAQAGFRLERGFLKRLRKYMLLLWQSELPRARQWALLRACVHDSVTRAMLRGYPTRRERPRAALLVWLIRLKATGALGAYLQLELAALRWRDHRRAASPADA